MDPYVVPPIGSFPLSFQPIVLRLAGFLIPIEAFREARIPFTRRIPRIRRVEAGEV